MRPTLEARGLKENLLQYLSTTYALTDEGAREALHRFLGDDTSGMFRGPYLRIRAPFTVAEDQAWRRTLDWAPYGFTPYAHQARAFARLSSARGHTPLPTLITTGTGSGKTESFLFPVLDHCARERAAGTPGVKALLLYPMNALATDQAQRINELLIRHRELSGVTAGLYIGERSAIRYERVETRRSAMQSSPPDILITNYKMLDLLLQRADDAPLWHQADLRYAVVDEFHTYDGAQGTDVAMLLRRLAAALGASREGRPLGDICPVATSATLASGATDDAGTERLRTVAGQVFATPFPVDAVIGEERQPVDALLPWDAIDWRLPLPTPEELTALPDPARGEEEFADLVEAVTGTRNTDPHVLGEVMKRHILTRAVLASLADGLRSAPDVLDALRQHGASSWGRSITERPGVSADALARLIALLSVARDPQSPPGERARPFVHVEVHQWARSVTRLLRGVLPWPRAEFRWDAADVRDERATAADRAAPVHTGTSGQVANLFLPAVYCRECGRSGWAVFSPESDDQAVEFDPARIRRASTSQDKLRVRNLIVATDGEAGEGAARGPVRVSGRTQGNTGSGRPTQLHGAGGMLMVLDGVNGRLRPPDPARDYDPATGEPDLKSPDTAFVLALLGETANTAGKEDWCPACGERQAIRYLGTGPAALAAAAITRLFTGNELGRDRRERKTLMFSDSVQDAAHRAGFVANRSYTFSLRALLKGQLSAERPTALHDLIADTVAATTDPEVLAAVVPPDLHGLRNVPTLLEGAGRGGDLRTWRLVGERLAFDTVMEFGFGSRRGRTLELTRTVAASVRIADPDAAAALVRSVHLDPEARHRHGPEPEEQTPQRYLGFLRVLLERLRTRGAVGHRWLDRYTERMGTDRYFINGRRAQGMRAFPPWVAAPVFLLDKPKAGSEFDFATGRLSWYERWAQSALRLTREQAPDFWLRLLPALHEAGLLASRVPGDSALRVYGLRPGGIEAVLLTDEQVNTAYVRCPHCFWEQTVPPAQLAQWDGQPCPTYRCTRRPDALLVAGDRAAEQNIHHRDRDYRDDYYRRLYREAGTYQVITAEHTGLLERAQREETERAFKAGERFNDPNVLACTPTLEMGIDIGDLSAVVLASLPRTPAGYTQRVGRAGRRDGNAFLLTIPERKRRDLYFLEEPVKMIAGEIVPPGCHLSAVEILRRQYLAHLLDLAARGELAHPEQGVGAPSSGGPVALGALPRRAPQLFGPLGYLAELVECALARGEELADRFLALFPEGVSEESADELRRYATGGLRGAAERAEAEWWSHDRALRARLDAIADAHQELTEREERQGADEEEKRQLAELDAERRGVGKQLMRLGEVPAQQALCDAGLLPNYALADTRTTLSAGLYTRDGEHPVTGRAQYRNDPRTYERPRRFAVTELAPGNTFYANGYRHRITGLEIGTPGHRAWQTWRLCQDCGYVRTADAETDTSPCPRCHSMRLADDGSSLFRVIQPSTVTSWDRAEDARIRDDRDERDFRTYQVVDAVDIPPEAIEPGKSWRHTSQTFGVDFTRAAVIRKVNVGVARQGLPAREEIAGQSVRLNPFHVCTGCGAATADGQPLFEHEPDGASSSGGREPRLRNHRPWCPRRRGRTSSAAGEPVRDERLLLAHELHTEALRVLLPAATMLVQEKIHSFRAALRLGVDQHFGGDPQHLDTTMASMPDAGTGERRWFLVLFDTLPGGTGYLHRLVDPDTFRQTLADAHRALTECPCAEEERRACHRCLRRYTPDEHQDVVSRREALDLIESLLTGPDGEDIWATEPVGHTGLIGLDAQVESDLEARFLAILRDWSKRQEDAALDEDGRASGHLRFTGGSSVTHWRLTAQQRLRGTRTDFTFTRADGQARSVKVYLDGRRFHATGEHNRLAQDAARRNALRADGQVVFQLTWDDLDLFEGRSGRARPVWPPYGPVPQEGAKDLYEQCGGSRAGFAGQVYVNPLDTLLAYLRDPEDRVWALRAGALVSGLMAVPSVEPVASTRSRAGVVQGLRKALTGDGTGESEPAEDAVHIFRAHDATGLPLVFTTVVDDTGLPRWSLLAVLDDSAPALEREQHRDQWRAWLYWTNLAQFLDRAGGDGVQLTTGGVDAYPLEALAVCGGARSGREPDTEPVARARAQDPEHAAVVRARLADVLRDPEWERGILPFLNEDGTEPELAELADRLAAAGKKAPVCGHELGSGHWLAEFAWEEHGLKVAVVPGGHHGPGAEGDQEAERRDAAYAAAGWTVRTAAGWLEHFESMIALLPDAPQKPKSEGAAR
ncbi:DEAD/DEAH box helicase [Streptomyces sp. JH002]|uniref:DEAD/DEAH box helicase n=1 Tax=Streptomyces sp. JH002 TaxID=2763259 RepID=UPI003D80967F